MQVMEMRKRVLGSEHPSTLTSMGNLESTFWNRCLWKEAEELEMQVMEMRKRVGLEHPETLISMKTLLLPGKSKVEIQVLSSSCSSVYSYRSGS